MSMQFGKPLPILEHLIVGCLNSALESLSTVEVYFDLAGLQAPDGGSILAEIIAGIGHAEWDQWGVQKGKVNRR
jgi:hypothetical protein